MILENFNWHLLCIVYNLYVQKRNHIVVGPIASSLRTELSEITTCEKCRWKYGIFKKINILSCVQKCVLVKTALSKKANNFYKKWCSNNLLAAYTALAPLLVNNIGFCSLPGIFLKFIVGNTFIFMYVSLFARSCCRGFCSISM